MALYIAGGRDSRRGVGDSPGHENDWPRNQVLGSVHSQYEASYKKSLRISLS
jgi:hypothetical protein